MLALRWGTAWRWAVAAALLAAAAGAWLGARHGGSGLVRGDLETFGAGPPRVLLIHTHAWEGYAAGTPPAAPADVVEAAALLGRALAARGVTAVHDRGFGRPLAGGPRLLPADDPYAAVRPRLRRLLQAFPSVELVLDVHRDALDHAEATGELRGWPAARLLWVVGSRPARGMDWWPNLRAAALLTERLQRTAPGLVRGIWVKPGPYNQDAGRLSALIEIGGDGSRPEEVERAIAPLADAVAWLLDPSRAGVSARLAPP
ncbi:MAG: stage II sporulation protein P [Firmicutes bacterium]|nr:stage II sporulation protein P [Bacillota bacterium]